MSSGELLERLILAESGIDGWKVRKHALTVDDVYSIAAAVYRMNKWNLIIDETPGLGIFELATRAKKEKAERGLDLLVVDYLQLISPPKAESRVQEVAVITRSLKVLAKELDIPILALSQLSRQAEQRESMEPRLSDLRDSGSIEQDSDQVVFLWRTAPEDPTERLAITEASVSKNRHGPTGPFTLALVKEQSRFVVR